jgi:pyruvate kinase
MVENLRAVRRQTGKSCEIAFDLAGSKLRRGPISRIIGWKPVRKTNWGK